MTEFPDALPLVSIVTPVLNGARFLADNLESVRGQDYPHLEHIVVDGGSEDGTLDLLRKAPGVVWSSARDRGMYDAINRGFREARGQVVAYQNADDRYASGSAVSIAVRHLQERPELDLVYGDFRYVDENGRPLGSPVHPQEFHLASLRRYNFVPPHSTFLRRRLLTEDGLWLDPDLRFAGDWDWFLRLAEAGKRFGRVNALISDFRRHSRSQTSTVGWGPRIKEWRRICRRSGASLPVLVLYEALLMPLRRRWAGTY
ncbi:MAG TPA: glycosyltransferase family 2 protein [Vicinamibacteria bacterium]|nr:glycosyltransferase family 2 protein [Vicinamibacteria bacterium]